MKHILLFLCLLLIEAHCSPVSAKTTLEFSMIVGGKSHERPKACATDEDGNCYIIGETNSPDFPFTSDNKQPGNFIMKVSPGGDILSIVSPAFLGNIHDCLFDKTGNIIVTYRNNVNELVLARLDRDGEAILSTHIIPNADTSYGSLAMDKSGRIYVAGTVWSADFPATPNAWQASFAGGSTDAFIWVFSADLQDCEYASYFGGTENEHIDDIKIDSNGHVHVVGNTISNDFPLTENEIDNILAHKGYLSSGFYAVFSPMFNELVFSTFLFNTSDPKLAVDSSGNGIITGLPPDYRIPGSEHSYDSGVLYRDNILLLSINPFIPVINYSAYIAGDEPANSTPRSESYSIQVDSNDHPIVVGITNAGNYPITNDAFQSEYHGIPYDAVISELDKTGSSLLYSTFLGGGKDDIPRCATLDKDGNLWIAGQTESTDFPADTKIQYHEVFNEDDMYVCKFARTSYPAAVDEEPKPEPLPTITAYPNPFNPTTTIRSTLPENSHATLTVFNVAGQAVRTLVDGDYAAGKHAAVWDGRDDDGNAVAAGVYVTQLNAGGTVATGKMALLK